MWDILVTLPLLYLFLFQWGDECTILLSMLCSPPGQQFATVDPA